MRKLATRSWAAREALARHEPFDTYGAFRAVDGYCLPFGTRLPPEWRERYQADGDEIAYTVLSYQTPIAWVLRSGVVAIPTVKYSRTTTGHQGLLYALHTRDDNSLSVAAQMERLIRGRGTRARDERLRGAQSRDILARIDDVLSRPVPVNSGESAIYTVDYLERKHGARGRVEAGVTMSYTIEITRAVVSYRTPVGANGGQWLDGEFRTLQPEFTTRETYDEDDAELWEGDVIAWAVDTVDRTGAIEPSAYPIGDTVPAHGWLSGRYEDPYEGDNKVTETSVRLTGDWSPQQRAEVFRAVSRS
ncbi:hypothetical protein [Streptomyces lasiicapitis]|uniref:hypothetical protein n=1 Tax=Streptomyces lasiicapitis TaxID=1923961 RepID=UPI00364FD798